LRQAELYAKVVAEIKRENDWIADFQSKTISEFRKSTSDIDKEMDNRF
jgi:hypothetical protein